jgi:hypothetical protein
MNKTRLLVIALSLTGALMIGLSGGLTAAEQRPSGGTNEGAVRAAIAKAAPVSFWAVTWDTSGSFDSMTEAVDRFTKETCNQGVEARLKSAPDAVILLREDPRGKSQFKFAVGLRVNERVEVREPLRLEEVKLGRAATIDHTGPYQQLQNVYETFEKYRERTKSPAGNGSGWPVVLVLENDPRRAGARAARTRLIAPL